MCQDHQDPCASPARRSRIRPTRNRQALAWVTGWALAVSAGAATGADSAGEVGSAAGIQLLLLGDRDAPLASASARQLSSVEDVHSALGNQYDRIELYGHRGSLEKVVAVPRGGQSVAAIPASGASPFASTRGAPAETGVSLSNALSIAQDPSASRDVRMAALATLGRSGSSAAVDLLQQLAAEEEDEALRDAAVLALGGFSGTDQAPRANAAFQSLAKSGAVPASKTAGPQSAYDVAPAVKQLQTQPDSLLRRQLVHKVAATAQDPALFTDFMKNALKDPNPTVREAAALSIGQYPTKVEGSQIESLLRKSAKSDDWGRVQRAANGSLRLLARGGLGDSSGRAADLTPEQVREARERNGGSCAGRGCGEVQLGGQ